MITSAQNPRIQHIRTLLTQRKAREESGEFVVEGVRLVEEALGSGWEARLLLYTSELSPRGQSLLTKARARGAEVEEIPPQLIRSSADTENPQGILGVFARRELPLAEQPNFIVVADAIRDPGNLGALLRTAAAAGAEAALLGPGCVDAFSPKVLRAGMGAHFRLALRQLDWDEIGTIIKPACRVYVAESGEGTPCWQLDLTQPVALIIGGEAEGAGAAAHALADGTIFIPMPGESESLNAAVAAGILLFEVVRQRNFR